MSYKDEVSKQKAALQKHAVAVKTGQREVQTAKLELGSYSVNMTDSKDLIVVS